MRKPKDELECAYCGSADVRLMNVSGLYQCNDCEHYFTDDEVEDGPPEHRREPKRFDDERY